MTSSGKRQSEYVAENGSAVKRNRSALPDTLRSAFRPSTIRKIVTPTSSAITLCIATLSTNPETFEINVAWPKDFDPDAMLIKGLIEQEAFSQGDTKKVFKLISSNKRYVGKAYFETGHGSDIGIVENSEELTKEAVRLQSLTAFWKAFEKHAKSQKCDIAKFQVTRFALAREVLVDAGTGPSPASGITEYTSLSEDELVLTEGRVSWITWLIEPERGNSDFKRWTGTMETKTHQDKAGTTINAFEHFAYVYSRKQMVFADLQSSESWDPENRAPVLFDVMTHSIKSDSGVGDFGPEGIEKWVQGHTCVQRCQQLSLPALDADIDSDPEEDEG